MFSRVSLLASALVLTLLVVAGCAAATPTPTPRPTMPPPTITPTPAPEFSWRIDAVLRASAIPFGSKLVSAESGKVFLVIQATVQNISGMPQTIYESRTHLRVQKVNGGDWTDFGVDGTATGAAGDAFGLQAMNYGFLGSTPPTMDPKQSERFAIVYSIPAGATAVHLAPQGALAIDLTSEWAGAEVYVADTPTPEPSDTPTAPATPTPARVVGTPGPLYTVVQVVDGDTVRVDLGGGKQGNVRMIGVEAPEVAAPGSPATCYSGEAVAKARELLDGKRVRLIVDPTQLDRDWKDRLFRYVEREDGLDVGLELLKGGFAKEFTYVFPYQRQPSYQSEAAIARDSALGLWSMSTCGGNTNQLATPTFTPTRTPTRTPRPTATPTKTPVATATKPPTRTPKPLATKAPALPVVSP